MSTETQEIEAARSLLEAAGYRVIEPGHWSPEDPAPAAYGQKVVKLYTFAAEALFYTNRDSLPVDVQEYMENLESELAELLDTGDYQPVCSCAAGVGIPENGLNWGEAPLSEMHLIY